MAIGTNSTETEYLRIKQQIWDKFACRLRAWRASQSRLASSPSNLPDMNPDVIVIVKNHTLLFEPQTPQAAAWLRNRYGLTADTMDGETGILVHPHQQKQLVAELMAAGFAVNM